MTPKYSNFGRKIVYCCLYQSIPIISRLRSDLISWFSYCQKSDYFYDLAVLYSIVFALVAMILNYEIIIQPIEDFKSLFQISSFLMTTDSTI